MKNRLGLLLILLFIAGIAVGTKYQITSIGSSGIEAFCPESLDIGLVSRDSAAAAVAQALGAKDSSTYAQALAGTIAGASATFTSRDSAHTIKGDSVLGGNLRITGTEHITSTDSIGGALTVSGTTGAAALNLSGKLTITGSYDTARSTHQDTTVTKFRTVTGLLQVGETTMTRSGGGAAYTAVANRAVFVDSVYGTAGAPDTIQISGLHTVGTQAMVYNLCSNSGAVYIKDGTTIFATLSATGKYCNLWCISSSRWLVLGSN